MKPSWNEEVHHNDPFEPGPVTVVERKPLAPNIQLLTVHAPVVAAKIQAGNFVIVRADEHGERTPLTVADWNREAGTVSCVFMTVGTSTYKLSKMKKGDVVPTFVGPLGKPFEVEPWGTVLLIGGCYGIGIIFPLARALKEKGNRVISVIEGRSNFLLYWQDRLEAVSDEVIYATKDLSRGDDRDAADVIESLVKAGEPLQRVFVVGCTFLMYHMAQVTRPLGIKTIVSLNPIMIDGTGMCGACRVSVGGETKFACVDGPDFDGHLVDWDLLLARRKAYLGPEAESLER
jgi:ferredoxin--NADP+ reductase